ncbi:MAG: acyl-CoA/acyl-ACP dehydrogenase [Pseudomonadales bacterium]|nr:acyl-CoA/acyl-ACP dehydrogenase [Pseudomonadales bacterium]
MTQPLNEDQEQFRAVVDRFLTDKSPTTQVRRLMETDRGYDAGVWKQLSQELGLAGTHLPEIHGGFGFGPVELGIVAEQMGRHLYCGPWFSSSVMAGSMLMLGADEQGRESCLPGIASGESIATLVLDDLTAPARVGQHIHADLLSEGATLSGHAGIVTDAHVADLLIVVAGTGTGRGLFSVAPDTAGVEITPLQSIDPTRKLCRVNFEAAAAIPLGELSEAAMEAAWDYMSMALAFELIGSAQVLFDSTIDYMKMRVQFGRTIASFQALKHKSADLLLELELAKATVRQSAHELANGGQEPWLCSMAKAMAADACMSVARSAIQLRGGIGFTWENDTHLWFKRAKSSEVFLGSPYEHRERVMQMMERSVA